MMRHIERQSGLIRHQRARGFSLMEVLIAMLILAIGLLGLASLQAQSLKFNHDSYVRSQSTILAYEMMDKMRADPASDYTDGVLDPDVPDDCDLSADATFINSVAPLVHKCFWLADIQGRLPAGTGTIVVNPADPNMFNVTIFWSDREINNLADCDALDPDGDATDPTDPLETRFFDAANNLCMVKQAWTVFP
jgi:type IV pilus assembly protein PilV